MAREHGRIRHAMWSDDDFRALKEAEQRAFMLALTQPGLSYCGVVPFTVRRWSGLAADSTVPKLKRAINSLAKKRYVVVDEDTEELLLRSFIRHDGILDSPNVVRAAIKDYANVQSPLLRAVIVLEVFRLEVELPRLGHPGTWDDVLTPWLDDVYPRTFPQGFPQGFTPALTRTLTEASGQPFPLAYARASRAAPAPTPAPKSFSPASTTTRRGLTAAGRPAGRCEVHMRDEPCTGCAADRIARKDSTT